MVIISVMLISSLVDLPLNIYKTFNIDERFGFNRMTAQIFILDLIKQSILSISYWYSYTFNLAMDYFKLRRFMVAMVMDIYFYF